MFLSASERFDQGKMKSKQKVSHEMELLIHKLGNGNEEDELCVCCCRVTQGGEGQPKKATTTKQRKLLPN